MLEENTKEIDYKFLNVISRFYLKDNRTNKKALIELAESGQFNAALICLKRGFKFDKNLFLYSFINLFGKNQKYLEVIYAFEEYDKFRNEINSLKKEVSSVTKKNWQLGTKVFPLFWTRAGEINCIDDNLSFSAFNLHEKIRSLNYAKIRQLREEFKATRYSQMKNEVSLIFLKEFLNDKPQFASILNMLDKSDDIIIFEPDISENIEELIYFEYANNPDDPIKSYYFADMVLSSIGSEHAKIMKKRCIDGGAVEEIQKIFNTLAQKDLHCQEKIKI